MITFNVQARNGNYYRGHEPCNEHGNCWSRDAEDALVFTIKQARKLGSAWGWTGLHIVISMKAEPMGHYAFLKELFCAQGGNWYDYREGY